MCTVLGTWTITCHKKKYCNFVSCKTDFDFNAKVIYILKSLNHVIVYYTYVGAISRKSRYPTKLYSLRDSVTLSDTLIPQNIFRTK